MKLAYALLLWCATATLAAAQPPTPAGVAVSGVVQDQTGAVLPAATVELVNAAGAVVQTTTADTGGAFRFERVAPGSYQLRAGYAGFNPATANLRVGTRPVTAPRLVLNLAALTQEITVSNAAAEVGTAAGDNVDAVSVDQNMLESLPVFDNDIVATMSQFLDAGSIGTSGVTVVVNGMEVNALNVSSSAVQQIRINQDPYSAEYSRPGRGRIEILTKPGGQEFHGSANMIFRNASLNAKNAFAETKAPEQRRIFEGFLGGPVGRDGKTAFMLSVNDEQLDQQSYIYAAGPDGIIQGNLPHINASALVSGSITHQFSDNNTVAVRPNYNYERDQNRGVGGTTLASAASTFTHNEGQVTYTQQTILSPTLVNQFQMLIGHEREPTVSAVSTPGIVVVGAFTGGGAQADLVRTETHMTMNESLGWTKGHHLLQAGFQVPDWSERGFFDRTNFGGTFYFSSLDAYAGQRPYSFIQQQGNGDLVLPREGRRGVHQGRLAGAARPFALLRCALRLAELLPRQQQRRTSVLTRVRAGQPEDERAARRRRPVQRSHRSGRHRRRAALAAGRPDQVRRHRPRVSEPVRPLGRRGGAAAQHRAARAGRPDSADAAVRRRARSSAAEDHDAVDHLHRVARLPPVPVARHQRADAAAVSRAPRFDVRRDPTGRVDRPPAERLGPGHAAREDLHVVQRTGPVHAEPRLQRHQRHRVVPGQRLRPHGRMGARRLRPAPPLPAARTARA